MATIIVIVKSEWKFTCSLEDSEMTLAFVHGPKFYFAFLSLTDSGMLCKVRHQ
jgi:hypothetical protein